MKRDEVKELFRTIVDAYPRFEVSPRKLDTWTMMLKGQDYNRAISNLTKHCGTSRFEPTIADVRSGRQPQPFKMDMTEGEP